jgi:hypothetical protein
MPDERSDGELVSRLQTLVSELDAASKRIGIELLKVAALREEAEDLRKELVLRGVKDG